MKNNKKEENKVVRFIKQHKKGIIIGGVTISAFVILFVLYKKGILKFGGDIIEGTEILDKPKEIKSIISENFLKSITPERYTQTDLARIALDKYGLSTSRVDIGRRLTKFGLQEVIGDNHKYLTDAGALIAKEEQRLMSSGYQVGVFTWPKEIINKIFTPEEMLKGAEYLKLRESIKLAA